MRKVAQPVLAIASALIATLATSCGGDRKPPTEPGLPITAPAPPPPAPPPGPPSPRPNVDLTISIDAAKRFQTIEGFGTSMRAFSDPHLSLLAIVPENSLRIPESAQRQILDSLYRGIGLTRVRIVPNARGIEPVNDNDDPQNTDLSRFDFSWIKNDVFFPAIREARARGVTTWWSAPVQIEPWMNLGNPEENVEWAMAILRRWRNEGLELPYYSVINEPSYERSQGPWPGEYMRDVVKLLGRSLKNEGFKTKIVIPDDLNAYLAARIAEVVLADPEARSYVAALPFHLYGGPPGQERELKELASRYGIPLWMSEHFVADGLAWGLSVHELLADSDVSAVDYLFGFFSESNQAQLISLLHRGTEYLGFRMEPHFYVFGQYSKYVRPGAVRVLATAPPANVKASAFVQNGRMTIVAINPGTTAVTVRFELAGHSGTERFSAVRTLPRVANSDRLTPQAAIDVVNGSIVAVLAPESMSTFFQ